MTKISRIMRQFVASAAFFTLSLATAEANEPTHVIDDPKNDAFLTAINNATPDTPDSEIREAFIDLADKENVFLVEVKAPYLEKIKKLKNKKDKKSRTELNRVYDEIDRLEEVAASKYYDAQQAALKLLVPDQSLAGSNVVTSAKPETKVVASRDNPVHVARAANNKIKIPKRPITLAELKKFAGDRKPVFDKGNKLDRDFLKSVIAEVPMPDVVKNPEKYIEETIMTFSDEASLNPVNVNRKKPPGKRKPTYAAGLMQAIPKTQKYLKIKAGFVYPVGKKYSDILGQVIYNTHYLDDVVNRMLEKEDEREKRNKEPVLGRVVLVEKVYAAGVANKTPAGDGKTVRKYKDFKKNSNTRTIYKKYYVPCTLDETTMLPSLSAGLGFYNDVADQIDRKMPAKYVGGLLVMQQHERQDFHLRLAKVSHDPAEQPVHEAIADKLRAMGYEVRLPPYEQEEKPTGPLLTETKVQNSTNETQSIAAPDIVPEPERVTLALNTQSLVSKVQPVVTSAKQAMADTMRRVMSFWQTKTVLTDPADATPTTAPAPTPTPH